MARAAMWIAPPILIVLIVVFSRPFPTAPHGAAHEDHEEPSFASEAALGAPVEPQFVRNAVVPVPANRSMPDRPQTRGPAPSPSVVRRSSKHWAIEEGPLHLELKLDKPQKLGFERDGLKHAGEDCWSPCVSGGMCAWCGQGNACCRAHFADDPAVCRGGMNFITTHHECVVVELEVHMEAKATLYIGDTPILATPAEGMFSVGSGLKQGWPSQWDGGGIDSVDVVGPWLVVSGFISSKTGQWNVQDRWRIYDGAVEGLRTWTWTGRKRSPPSVLCIGWVADGQNTGLMMPGVLYHGNPSGSKAARRGWAMIPSWTGKPGERLQVEEHRMAQTWASFEWPSTLAKSAKMPVAAAIHAVPSSPPYAQGEDVSWTMGAEALSDGTMLQMLSGPVAMNGKVGVVKTGQNQVGSFEKVGLEVPKGKMVQKRYFLQVTAGVRLGWGFRNAISWSIQHADLSAMSLPRVADIVGAKVRFAMSRWAGSNDYPGFAMYPGRFDLYVMGWAGQAEAPGYALQVLAERLGQPGLKDIAYKALDALARARFNDKGFNLALNGYTGQWTQQDPVSQGQAMSAFARAIRFGRNHGAATKTWEDFLKKACGIHSKRILKPTWKPRSTAEAFMIQPLAIAAGLFKDESFMKAAIKAGEHYVDRHVGPNEPFWGGTLDANCEDKEGAWAGFEAFLALHEATGDENWLTAASYAADVVLTYTYLWDVDLPPGRLRDHNLHTRGWTAVSVQNMHLDVYGVLYTPRLWRLGQLTNRPELLQLAELMYRTCGQMLDAQGSQGEQLQQTRFAQAGDMSDPDRYRGGYVESWTVFWIAAHFLTAAALFEEMGVLGDLWNRA